VAEIDSAAGTVAAALVLDVQATIDTAGSVALSINGLLWVRSFLYRDVAHQGAVAA
jgi:hypothetical protein